MKRWVIVAVMVLGGCKIGPMNWDDADRKAMLSDPLEQPTPTPTADPELVTADWQTYEDKVYGYRIKVPEDWEVTPTPIQGFGGVAQFRGENLGEKFKIEVGKQDLSKDDREDLGSYEVRRTREQDVIVIESELKKVAEREFFSQRIELSTGDTDKEIGLYYIINVGSEVYFVEAYVADEEMQIGFVETLLTTWQFE